MPVPRSGANAVQRINALGEMASGIAHDFRNVLAVIGSALSLAERHGGEAMKANPYLTAARDGVERGLRLTSRLLALARPGIVERHPESLSRLIREFLPFLRYGAGPRVAVRLELDESVDTCLIDRAQFNAALLNLVVNARDAMPGGGSILIRTDTVRAGTCDIATGIVPRFVRVRVSDTGSGMSEKVAARIFDPWFTTKGETGTGLGLPQVHRLMTSIGGSIQVSSTSCAGTAFDLYFPVDGQDGNDQDMASQVDRWINEGGSTVAEPIRR